MRSKTEWSKETLGESITVYTSAAHAFGIDAFLLADFAAPKHGERVCDFGTGCGIIPMLLARTGLPREIVGVEIQPQGVRQFEASICESQTRMPIVPVCADLKARETLKGEQFDLITCNPPYKAAGGGILSEQTAEQIARHETMCTLEDLCVTAKRLLRFGGRFCICQRPERLSDAMVLFRQYGIEPKRLRLVCRDKDSAPWLFLLMGQRGAKPHLRIEENFFVYENGVYTKETRRMYGESFQMK